MGRSDAVTPGAGWLIPAPLMGASKIPPRSDIAPWQGRKVPDSCRFAVSAIRRACGQDLGRLSSLARSPWGTGHRHLGVNKNQEAGVDQASVHAYRRPGPCMDQGLDQRCLAGTSLPRPQFTLKNSLGEKGQHKAMSLTQRSGLAWLRCCLGGRVERHTYNLLSPAAEEPDMAIPWELSPFSFPSYFEVGPPSVAQRAREGETMVSFKGSIPRCPLCVLSTDN